MRAGLLLALLGVLGLTWWASQRSPSSMMTETVADERIQDYFVHGLILQQFDLAGGLSHVLEARHLAHFKASGLTRLTLPSYILYARQRPDWTIQANSGSLNKEKTLLQLLGETHIDWQGDEQRPAMHLVTSNLMIHPQQEYAETDAAVTVTSAENWIESMGMQAWLKTPGKIRFLAQTRAHYVAQ